MFSAVLSRLIILLAGVLYPAYCSFKAVRTRNMKAYVRWMIYWIVYALFSSVEAVTDMFVAWIPFYYEMKILTVLWLVSPATRGCILFFKRFLQPALDTREREIDSYIDSVGAKGYGIIRQLSSNALGFAFSSILKGHMAVVEHVKKSYFQIEELHTRDGVAPTAVAEAKIADDVDSSSPSSTIRNSTPSSDSSHISAATASDHRDAGTTGLESQSSASRNVEIPSSASAHIPPRTYSSYSSASSDYSRSSYQPYGGSASSRYEASSVSSSMTRPSTEEPAGSYYDRYVKSRTVSSTSYRSTSAASSSYYGSSYARK